MDDKKNEEHTHALEVLRILPQPSIHPHSYFNLDKLLVWGSALLTSVWNIMRQSSAMCGEENVLFAMEWQEVPNRFALFRNQKFIFELLNLHIYKHLSGPEQVL